MNDQFGVCYRRKYFKKFSFTGGKRQVNQTKLELADGTKTTPEYYVCMYLSRTMSQYCQF